MHPRTELSHVNIYQKLIKTSNVAALPTENTLSQPTNSQTASVAFENAKAFSWLSRPVITKLGWDVLTGQRFGDGLLKFLDDILIRPLGIPLMIGGVIVDTAKFPLALLIACEEFARGIFYKSLSTFWGDHSPEDRATKHIYQSISHGISQTAAILIELDIINREQLSDHIEQGNIKKLLALTILRIAIKSRNYSNGIILPNNKLLERKHCPQSCQTLFEGIMDLKNKFNLSNASSHFSNQDRVLKFLKDFYQNNVPGHQLNYFEMTATQLSNNLVAFKPKEFSNILDNSLKL